MTTPHEEELQTKLMQARQKLDQLRTEVGLSFDERLERLKTLSDEITALHAELEKFSSQPEA